MLGNSYDLLPAIHGIPKLSSVIICYGEWSTTFTREYKQRYFLLIFHWEDIICIDSDNYEMSSHAKVEQKRLFKICSFWIAQLTPNKLLQIYIVEYHQQFELRKYRNLTKIFWGGKQKYVEGAKN